MAGSAQKNIALLNFPHYGHIIPFLELGKKLSRYHVVDFLVSEARIPEIHARELLLTEPVVTGAGGSLRLVSLPDGLDLDQCNRTGDMQIFKLRLDRITAAFETFLDAHSPDVVIADLFLHGTAKLTHSKGITFYFFHTASARSALEIFAVKNDAGSDPRATRHIAMKSASAFSDGIIFNTAAELHPQALALVKACPVLQGKDLKLVGPIFSADAEKESESHVQFRVWLDDQEPGSVVYVSFGSLSVPLPKQIYQVGLALLSLGKPFILSLPAEHRTHLSQELHAEVSASLLTGRKFLITSWAPQKLILGHSALGVFVSHCGWNSTTEAMYEGVPIVGWPLFGDQSDNAEWFCDNGIGEKVEGTGRVSETTVPAADIAGIIRKVGDWDDAARRSYRINAAKWRDVLREAVGPTGSSTRDFADLVKFGAR
ncbi:putative UDP-glycosyltransferase 73D1 [Hypsibius exemplaris]|uniref:UDP-glucuronosyltransferase n=1 Tax=Hypsibius exemplaris TaxID=2072580 RepID=A0A1W0XDE3_HYPEX|nr:putative UDP-glycosyltransferase 73D1 [Hypsibius exemplaris]